MLQTALTFENGGKFLRYTYYAVPIFFAINLAITRGAGLIRHSKKLEKQHLGDAAKTPSRNSAAAKGDAPPPAAETKKSQ